MHLPTLYFGQTKDSGSRRCKQTKRTPAESGDKGQVQPGQTSGIEKVESSIEHLRTAKTLQEKLNAAGTLLEQMAEHAKTTSTKDKWVRSLQLLHIQKLDRRNSALLRVSKGTVTPKSISFPDANRSTTDFEVNALRNLFFDLTNSSKPIADDARKKLAKLGVDSKKLEKIESALREFGKTTTVRFAGITGEELTRQMIDEAVADIINKSSSEQVMNALIDHQVESVLALVEPIFSGMTAYNSWTGSTVDVPWGGTTPPGYELI